MFQLSLLPESPVATPPTLHELKQSGRAFIVHTWRGWSAWIPNRPGFITGMYYTADSYEEAIAEVAEFNQQKGTE